MLLRTLAHNTTAPTYARRIGSPKAHGLPILLLSRRLIHANPVLVPATRKDADANHQQKLGTLACPHMEKKWRQGRLKDNASSLHSLPYGQLKSTVSSDSMGVNALSFYNALYCHHRRICTHCFTMLNVSNLVQVG
jgi:hypothetical protein